GLHVWRYSLQHGLGTVRPGPAGLAGLLTSLRRRGAPRWAGIHFHASGIEARGPHDGAGGARSFRANRSESALEMADASLSPPGRLVPLRSLRLCVRFGKKDLTQR